MSKRQRHVNYRITRPASGSFVGSAGRVTYAVEPGVVRDDALDPQVLRILLASGVAVKATKPSEEAEA